MDRIIAAVSKAIDLLFLFRGETRLLDVKTMSARLGLPLRTTYRLVNTLLTQNVIVPADAKGSYRLSPRLYTLLAAIQDAHDIRRVALPFLADLSRETGETAQLYIFGENSAVLVETSESTHPLRVGPLKGTCVPLHCGAGAKPLLAFMPDEARRAYYRRSGLKTYAPNTVIDANALERQLAEIRETLFAVSHQEFVSGVRSLGTPIRDALGRVSATLGLVGPDTRLTPEKAEAYRPLFLKIARQIERASGRVREDDQ